MGLFFVLLCCFLFVIGSFFLLDREINKLNMKNKIEVFLFSLYMSALSILIYETCVFFNFNEFYFLIIFLLFLSYYDLFFLNFISIKNFIFKNKEEEI